MHWLTLITFAAWSGVALFLINFHGWSFIEAAMVLIGVGLVTILGLLGVLLLLSKESLKTFTSIVITSAALELKAIFRTILFRR